MKKRFLWLFFVIVISASIFLFIYNKDTTNVINEEMQNQKELSPNDSIKQGEGQGEQAKNDEEQIEVGVNVWNKAPNFILKDQSEKQIQLEDYQGKKILLNFWTSWCRYCKAEMNELTQYYQENNDPNIIILSINVSKEERKVEDAYLFVQENNLPFPVVFDQDGEVTQLYRVQGYPTNLFIDQSGIIRQRILGGITLKDVETIFKDMK